MDDFFTSEEKKELFSLYRHLLQSAGDTIFWKDCQKLKKHLIKAAWLKICRLPLSWPKKSE